MIRITGIYNSRLDGMDDDGYDPDEESLQGPIE
jgi:hypothetical protein